MLQHFLNFKFAVFYKWVKVFLNLTGSFSQNLHSSSFPRKTNLETQLSAMGVSENDISQLQVEDRPQYNNENEIDGERHFFIINDP